MGGGHLAAHAERIEARRRWWGTGRAVLVRATVSLITSLLLLNILGAVATGLVAVFVVPEPDSLRSSASLSTYIVLAATYFVVAIVVGVAMGARSLSSLGEW